MALKSVIMLAATAVSPVSQPVPTPPEIVAEASASDWVAIAPSDLLVMDLAPVRKDGASTSSARRVVIQLIPPPFSQGWVGNIRKLAAARWWDGTSVNRVQDNYVVQWGDGNADDKAKARALPAELAVLPETAYRTKIAWPGGDDQELNVCVGQGLECPEYYKARLRLQYKDAYADGTFFTRGWPYAYASEQPQYPAPPAAKRRKSIIPLNTFAWPVHCYGMVGVGRDLSPNTGSGAELYTVIGHAPRHLDRNIALVGRVIEGIEHLSSLPRGTEALGFYKTAEERVPIVSVRLGNEVKDLPRFEYLSTESESFARYADARANRRDPFFIAPAGGADICNIPVPVRRAP